MRCIDLFLYIRLESVLERKENFFCKTHDHIDLFASNLYFVSVFYCCPCSYSIGTESHEQCGQYNYDSAKYDSA